jgi:hypothetical protein
MAERRSFDEIDAQLPSRWHPIARAKMIGDYAIAWGGTVGYHLPFDDQAKPSRWQLAPTYRLSGLRSLIAASETRDSLDEYQETAEEILRSYNKENRDG